MSSNASRSDRTRVFRALLSAIALLATHSAVAEDTLRLALRSTYPAASVGFLLADHLGFYEELGLDVTFVVPENSEFQLMRTYEALSSGAADLAIGGTDVFVDAVGSDRLVAVFTTFQTSPARIFLKRDAPITTIADFVNLPVILSSPGSRLRIELEAVLAINGISIADMNTIVAEPDADAIELIRSDGVAGFPGSLLASQYVMRQLDMDLVPLDPASYGLEFYGETVFATEEFVRDHAEEVEQFRTATRRGWEYAFTHPEETVEFLHSTTTLPPIIPPFIRERDFLAWQLGAIESLTGYPVVDVGYSSRARWSGIASALEELGISERGVIHERFVFDYQAILADQRRTQSLLLAALLGLAVGGSAMAILGRFLATRARTRREIDQFFDGVLHGAAFFRRRDASYRLVRANRVMKQVVGITPEQEQAGLLQADTVLTGLGMSDAESRAALDEIALGVPAVRRDSIVSGDGSRFYSISLFALTRRTIGIAVLDVTSEHTARQALEDLVHQRTVTIREVHHRVRNNMQIITSLMSLQAEYLTSSESLQFQANMQNQIRALSVAHEMLYEDFTDQYVAIGPYIHQVAGDTFQHLQQHTGFGPREVELQIDGVAGVRTSLDTAIPIGLVVTEAITNAERHAFADANVNSAALAVICTVESTQHMSITVRDNGIGCTDERLRAGLGIRVMEILSEQINGSLTVASIPGAGTTVIVTIPSERID